MKLLAILVGKPKDLVFREQTISTAINKDLVVGPVRMNELNIEGDQQADLKVHGGRDKAIYAYGFDAYDRWKKIRPQNQFPYGAMGENLCMDELDENSICIGDTFSLGSAIIQVSEPRFPCSRLTAKYADPELIKQFVGVNRPGIYYRVLQSGTIEAGNEMKVLDQEKIRFSITEFFALGLAKSGDPSRLQEVLTIKNLNENWRKKIATNFGRN